MKGVDAINQRLRELDVSLSERRIEAERYRFLRRTLIGEFEEQNAFSGAAGEATHPERTANAAGESTLPARSESVAGPNTAGLRPGRVIGVTVGAALVASAVAGAWWALAPKTEAVTPVEGKEGPVMPQDLARRLLDGTWTDVELRRFQEDWETLAPASRNAATEDPRMWLLRREIDQRLRNAREAVALHASEHNVEQVRLLEHIQTLIRHDPG